MSERILVLDNEASMSRALAKVLERDQIADERVVEIRLVSNRSGVEFLRLAGDIDLEQPKKRDWEKRNKKRGKRRAAR
jgi:hypothetical protein